MSSGPENERGKHTMFTPGEMVEDTDGACDGRQMENACIFVVSSSAPESERGVLFPVEVGAQGSRCLALDQTGLVERQVPVLMLVRHQWCFDVPIADGAATMEEYANKPSRRLSRSVFVC